MNEDKYKEKIGTRVTPEVLARLTSICKLLGLSIFQLLRMLLDCIIRFMDDVHNLSENLLRIIRLFEGIRGWRKSICLAEDLDDAKIIGAFYIIKKPHRDGVRVVYVERPLLDGDEDNWQCTYNSSIILERFMEVLNPSLYLHLRRLGVDLGTESMLDTVHTIANLYMANPDENELRKMFENNNWHKGGQADQDIRYQTRKFHKMDYMDKGRLFDDWVNDGEPTNAEE